MVGLDNVSSHRDTGAAPSCWLPSPEVVRAGGWGSSVCTPDDVGIGGRAPGSVGQVALEKRACRGAVYHPGAGGSAAPLESAGP